MSIFNTGTGIKGNPFRIYTEDDLFEMAGASQITSTNNYFSLENDITLTKDWLPIGTTSRAFSSKFDGNGYTIKNININNNEYTYQGFFGYISYGYVKNLRLEDVTITSNSQFCGAIAGGSSYPSIENCWLKNITLNHTGTDESSKALRYGGVIGYISTSSVNTSIKACVVENVTINNSGGYIGGFVGYISGGNFEECLVIGDVSLNLNPINISSTTTYAFSANINVNYSKVNRCGVKDIGLEATIPLSLTKFKFKKLNNPTDITEYISGNNTDWGGSYWGFGDDKRWNMTDGSLPYFTWYGTLRNPIMLYTWSDIETKMMNSSYEFGLSGAFKLANDIEHPKALSSGGNAGGSVDYPNICFMSENPYSNDRPVFSGFLDGNGFGFKKLKHNKSYSVGKVSFNVYLFYSLNQAVIKNLTIHYENLNSSSNYGFYYLFAYSCTYSLFENIQIKVDRVYQIDNLYGFPSTPTYSIVRNIKFDYNDINFSNAQISYWFGYIGDYGLSSTNTPLIENVSIKINSKINSFPSNIMYKGTSSTVLSKISGVTAYIEGYPKNSHTMPLTLLPTLEDYRDGSNPAYVSYQDDWFFDGVNDPIQKRFVKIIEKIEERLVKSYSIAIKTLTSRYKGRLDSVKSFSKAFTSKGNRFISTKLKTLSYAIKNVSKTYKKSKGNKDVNSYVNTIKTSTIATKLRKTLKNVKSFTKKIIGKTSNQKKVLKQIKGFTKKIGSNIKKYKGVIRTSKSFVKRFFSNSIYSIGKLIKVKSYTNRFEAKIFTSFLTKTIIKIKSYSLPIVGKLRRFSNIYKFVRKTVKGYANAIVSKGERKGFRKLIVMSFTKGINGLSKSFHLVKQIQNVMAIITHKFSKMKIFKRENESTLLTKKHNTKINQKDDGGEG